MSVSAVDSKSAELVGRLDRLPFSRWHRNLFTLCFLGVMFDACDFALFGMALPPVAREFGLNQAQAGLLATVGLVGAFLGALFWGTISDYIGRRTSFCRNDRYLLAVHRPGGGVVERAVTLGLPLPLEFRPRRRSARRADADLGIQPEPHPRPHDRLDDGGVPARPRARRGCSLISSSRPMAGVRYSLSASFRPCCSSSSGS